MKARAKILTTAIAVLVVFLSSHSQCAAASDGSWDSNFGVPGADGSAYAVAVDGNSVYFGGQFSHIGGVDAAYIAKWDGTNWSPLGVGTDGRVISLVASDNCLYASGAFTNAGGSAASGIAKWDGTNWSPLGTGVNGGVAALAVVGNDLFASGFFTSAGGIAVSNIARWNGNSWSDVGGGLNGTVRLMATDGTNLYVGGSFSQAGSIAVANVARWDGNSWSAMGNTGTPPPAAIRLRGSEVYLFALGGFYEYETKLRILKWDGTNWLDFASGEFPPINCNDCSTEAYDMAISGNDFYIAGFFEGAIAKWDGTANWSWLRGGLSYNGDAPIFVRLATSGSELYVTGSFLTAGGIPSKLIALWRIPHSLNATRNGNSVTLSWPATGSNFVLEANATLDQTNWSFVSQSPVVIGDQLVVTNEISSTSRFYRLRRR